MRGWASPDWQHWAESEGAPSPSPLRAAIGAAPPPDQDKGHVTSESLWWNIAPGTFQWSDTSVVPTNNYYMNELQRRNVASAWFVTLLLCSSVSLSSRVLSSSDHCSFSVMLLSSASRADTWISWKKTNMGRMRHTEQITDLQQPLISTDGGPSPCANWALSPSVVSPVSTSCAAAASLVLAVVPRPAGAAPVTMATAIQHDNRKWGPHNLACPLTAAPSSSCSLETVTRRSWSNRTDSWSPRRRALNSALSLLSCRFLLLRSRTSSRYLEFYREQFSDSNDWVTQHFQQTSLCSRSSSALLLSASLSSSSSFLLTDRKHF